MSAIITDAKLHTGHNLHDRLLGARMLGWMVLESGGKNWWLCGATADGKVVEWDSGTQSSQPRYDIPKDKRHYAMRVLTALANLECDGGTWLVGWMDGCKKFQLVFKDADGDIKTCVDSDKSWLVIREWPMDTWTTMAATAFEGCYEIEAVLELRGAEQYKLAAGEKPPSQH